MSIHKAKSLIEFYRGKKVFVTGNTGFKGAVLCQMLQHFGAIVQGYSLEPPTNPALYTILGKDLSLNTHIGDIRDFQTLNRVFERFQPEIVFHLAAQPLVRESYQNPLYTYETNVMGTVHICECIRKNNSVRSFVNVTTDKVYQNEELEIPFTEEMYLDGHDPYSNSKSCSELVTHSYVRSFFQDMDIAVSTARAGNVIGGGDFAKDRIVPDCYRAAIAGNDIVLRNPYSIRPYQHVLEPLYVYLLIAKEQYEDRKKQGSYNVGPDDESCITTGELTDLFCQYWGDDLKWVNQCDGGPHEAGFLKLDCTKLKNTFGWKPFWTVDEAVQKTVEWYKAYYTGMNMIEVTNRQIGGLIDV